MRDTIPAKPCGNCGAPVYMRRSGIRKLCNVCDWKRLREASWRPRRGRRGARRRKRSAAGSPELAAVAPPRPAEVAIPRPVAVAPPGDPWSSVKLAPPGP